MLLLFLGCFVFFNFAAPLSLICFIKAVLSRALSPATASFVVATLLGCFFGSFGSSGNSLTMSFRSVSNFENRRITVALDVDAWSV